MKNTSFPKADIFQEATLIKYTELHQTQNLIEENNSPQIWRSQIVTSK
jgi:hypothetical protein